MNGFFLNIWLERVVKKEKGEKEVGEGMIKAN